MAFEEEFDPRVIEHRQQEERNQNAADWVRPILEAAEERGGAGVAITRVEQRLMVIHGIELAKRHQDPNAVKRIQATGTVEGDYSATSDQLLARLERHDEKYGGEGIIIVEGIDPLGTVDKMGNGNPGVYEFLTQLAYWRRSTSPEAGKRSAVIGLGLIAVGQEVHVSGNTVRRPDMGTRFVDIFDKHFIVNPYDEIQDLTFTAVDPRTAGFGLANTRTSRKALPPSDENFSIETEVRNSQAENRLP